MLVKELLDQVKQSPSTIQFADVISCIDSHYVYSPTAFRNGSAENAAGTNEGSCKIFAFAQIHALNLNETLSLFGTFYRDDVLKHPKNNDHANIRNFMQSAWDGIAFETIALVAK